MVWNDNSKDTALDCIMKFTGVHGMRWYTHAIFAFIMGAVLGYILGVDLGPYYFIVTVASGTVIDFLEIAVYDNHKRNLHNLFILIPSALLYIMYDATLGAGLTVGLFSHIVLDCMTPTGCPLLYPLKKMRYAVKWKNKNSKARERRILAVMVVLAFCTVVIMVPHSPVNGMIESWAAGQNTGNRSDQGFTGPHLSLSNPTRDVWIHPFSNGSIFIDVEEDPSSKYHHTSGPSRSRYKPQGDPDKKEKKNENNTNNFNSSNQI